MLLKGLEGVEALLSASQASATLRDCRRAMGIPIPTCTEVRSQPWDIWGLNQGQICHRPIPKPHRLLIANLWGEGDGVGTGCIKVCGCHQVSWGRQGEPQSVPCFVQTARSQILSRAPPFLPARQEASRATARGRACPTGCLPAVPWRWQGRGERSCWGILGLGVGGLEGTSEGHRPLSITPAPCCCGQ